jgi:carboxymethylenebutenolidase
MTASRHAFVRFAARCARAATGALALGLASGALAAADAPLTVRFASADGTALVGYVFAPNDDLAAPRPAVVMLHGRAGPYSSNVNGRCTRVGADIVSPCDATTLSRRHLQWGRYWAEHGRLAILVDSFGPRGKAHGFGRGTHDNPERDDVNERSVRPLDALGALRYLRARGDVDSLRIALQGWSNGGSTALNAVARGTQEAGFQAALVLYPGCGPRAVVAQAYATAVPLLALLAADDEEVSPAACERMFEHARRNGSPVAWTTYPGATHDFDDPGMRRQAIAANRAARDDALRRALDFVANPLH